MCEITIAVLVLDKINQSECFKKGLRRKRVTAVMINLIYKLWEDKFVFQNFVKLFDKISIHI